VIDAVGMEAHGAPIGKLAHQMTSLLPDALAAKLMDKAGVDLVSERLGRLARRGIETIDLREAPELGEVIRDRTDGRGTDAVIDAVGMEAHGSGGAKAVQRLSSLLPDAVAGPLINKAGIDRLAALQWFERGRTACGPPGLLTEEYDVGQRQLRGNLPQAFTHALLFEAAHLLAGDVTA
jgi:hypothetical protein